ncbi:hypothetical protein DFH11DRAFT_1572618, partial [Phellopilus nigrolimitatus]
MSHETYHTNQSSHPIQHLPPEILSIIFWYSIPLRSGFVEPSIRRSPLLLCRVCKKWRDLAERTPELWSSISLFLLRPYVTAIQAFEKWIAMSGNCPLSIKVVVLTHFGDAWHPLMSFIEEIAKQSHRWLVADISVPSCYMQKLLANEAPILQKLVLADPLIETGGESSRLWERRTFKLSAAPALRQLILKQPLRILPSIIHPITSIHFDAFTLPQVSDLLDGCPQLEDLAIKFKEVLVFSGPDIWTLPRLRSLRVCLHYANCREMGKFLDYLRLPSLRSLTVDGLRIARHHHLLSLLDRTDGGLEDLTLLNITVRHSEIYEYLKRLPFLKILRLVDSHGLNNQCVYRLTWLPEGETNVCPCLQELWLLRSECQNLSLDAVEHMEEVDSPVSPQPAPLKEIRFDGSQRQHNALRQRAKIKSCIENGLVWK